MKILMISMDRNILDENSEARQRMVEYGRFANELHIIIFAKKRFQNQNFGNIFLYPTNSRNRWFYVWDAIKIGKKINNVDLITTQDPFETGLVGYRIAKKRKSPLQLQIHTDFLSPYFRKESLLNKIRVYIAKFLIPRANCIRAVSKRIKKSIDSRLKTQDLKIKILPIFIDVEKIKNAPIKSNLHKKYSQFDFIILMASRLEKEKNIGLVIRAMKDIIKEYPKTGLIIVGSGPEEKNLKSQISNLKMNENIKIEDWTNDLISYYKTADLFLLTSNYEGYGRTIIEAVASSCNIISSNVGIANEILAQGNIFEPGNKESLKEKIIKAIKGDIKPLMLEARLLTKEEYLEKYKKSWETCGY